MSLVFNMVGSSGGSSAELPAIYVTYPEGAICTCSKAGKTYTAKDTSGYWLFAGIEVGTWIVTIKQGGNAATDNVEITNSQLYKVELNFGTPLYSEGNQYSSFSGGWTVTGDCLIETSTILIQGAGMTNRANNANYIDFSSFSTLYVDISEFYAGEGNGAVLIQLVSNNGTSYASGRAYEAGIASLPIGNVNAACQVWLRPDSSRYMYARVSRVAVA